jgi:tetratricopeptide (TPR) repeat protein
VIAEDLLARNPHSDVHGDRLRRALGLLGIDAEETIARCRDGARDAAGTVDLDGVSFDFEDDEGPAAEVSGDASSAGEVDLSAALDSGKPADNEPPPDSFLLDVVEIDLTDALAGLGAASPILPPPPVTTTEEPVDAPADLEAVFAEMRARARREDGGDGREQYEHALQQLEHGQIAEALAGLRAAARAPLYRFRASARLGRLYAARGDVREGIEWLERAADAPPPTADEGWAVLYDLGTVLEQVGERARALAIFLELEADAASYRDVRARIEDLSRAQAGKA